MRVEHGRVIVEDGEERPTHWAGIRILYEEDFPCHLPPGKYVMATNVYMTPIELEHGLKDVTLRGTPVEPQDSASRIGDVPGHPSASRLRLAVRRLLDRRRRRIRLRHARTEDTQDASEDYA